MCKPAVGDQHDTPFPPTISTASPALFSIGEGASTRGGGGGGGRRVNPLPPPPPPSAKFYRESPENKFTVICSLFITYLLLALESSETESLKQHKIAVRNLLISRAPFSKREFEGIQSSVVWAGPEGVRLRKS